MNTESWFDGQCKDCGYNLVITQPTEEWKDYWWYCSNKECPHHHPGEQTGDMEFPTFLDEKRYWEYQESKR
jgi:hypothetical protein